MCVPLQLSEEMSLNYSSAFAAKCSPLFQTRLPNTIYCPFNSISVDGAAMADLDCIYQSGTGLLKIRKIIKSANNSLVIDTVRAKLNRKIQAIQLAETVLSHCSLFRKHRFYFLFLFFKIFLTSIQHLWTTMAEYDMSSYNMQYYKSIDS